MSTRGGLLTTTEIDLNSAWGSRSRQFLLVAASAFMVCLFSSTMPLFAQSTINISSSADLANAVQTINSNPSQNYILNFTTNVTMSQQAIPISTNGTITVAGNGFTLNGAGTYRPFFIESGTVALQNMTISNAAAQGGIGGQVAGGGLGAGAAVFVDSNGHLTIKNVTFSNNSAMGGAGGGDTTGFGGGGGGLGGAGGKSTGAAASGGGGGGLYGTGGDSSAGAGGGGGGGGLGSGGAGSAGNGGGGGGLLTNGASGGAGGTAGTPGGNGGTSNNNGSNAAAAGGGGGGAGLFGAGGNGSTFGGGGGGSLNTIGGAGGDFGGGGGGGSTSGSGGNGGFGGGGGAGGFNAGGGVVGGNGGFGGGGGGYYNGGTNGTAGTSTFGGGNGTNGAGGGGAGFGGAIFVRSGGTITILDSTSFSGNTATGGAGGTGTGGTGGTGSSDGNDLFLMRGVSSVFDISNGQTLSFSPVIGNDDGTAQTGVTLDKTGLGTLILSGNSSLMSATTVDAGTLVVNGTLGGTMTVNNTGILMGQGTILGDTQIHSGGVIHPGNVGTALTINGNFTQSTGSTYTADVSPTQSDRITVGGTATIQSGTTLNLQVNPGAYTAGTHYTLMSATGGIFGTYSTTNLPSPGAQLIFSLLYNPNDIELLVNQSTSFFQSLSTSGNQLAVAAVLDASAGGSSGDFSAVITNMQGMSANQVPGMMTQLTNDLGASISGIQLQTSTAWMNQINNRIAGALGPASLGNGQASVSSKPKLILASGSQGKNARIQNASWALTGAPTSQWNSWGQGYGFEGWLGNNGNAGGLGYGVAGTVFGADRWVNESVMIGAFGGYAGTAMHDRLVSSNASITTFQVGAYELLKENSWYISNIDAYANSDYASTRQIYLPGDFRTATGNSNGNQYAHYTEAGLEFSLGHTIVQPFTEFNISISTKVVTPNPALDH